MHKATQVNAVPVATTTTPRPDFQVFAPTEYFLEISTLNLSEAERAEIKRAKEANVEEADTPEVEDVECAKIERTEGIPRNHSNTLRRILLRATDEKKDQFAFAASQRKPCALVLFDYTMWSGFGTQFSRFLANGLLGKPFEFSQLSANLSAVVYVERKVIDGRIAISRNRSAAYYNPNAIFPLPPDTFSAIGQFRCQMKEIPPQCEDQWVAL